MGHPLIDRLTEEMGWPHLTEATALSNWTAREGVHVAFCPGDPKRNLETADVAVILPELRLAFQGRFDCAVVAGEAEARAKDDGQAHKTPSLIFYRDGRCLGAIPKVRDWDDYMARTAHFLNQPAAEEAI
ncbi:hydrogenase accessory protein [Jannaschia pagri]|uniref:Hydrogenase accessory protein n=1 Tax=Jannaschia pagri TaxID=2829797 RepID=A0ABQ4NR48_9RHOB|nr:MULTISPECIES: hydrogenase accessory protein [unclassified Jannaschia]GIT93030.1 hydrogenase accessory protein [Jannaschia sp. AI_61]GIT96865.1 hydrogenase accessory protein [Jannaschia sp. AI_62]